MKNQSSCLTFIALLWATLTFSQPGTPDPSFSGDGKLTASFLSGSYCVGRSVVIQPDAKIVVAVNVSAPSQTYTTLVRYSPEGTLDNSFGSGGKVDLKMPNTSFSPKDLTLQPDGKVVLAGSILDDNYYQVGIVLFRINANGTPDNTFGGGDGMITSPVSGYRQGLKSVVLQTDGKIVAGGWLQNTSNGYSEFSIMRFNTNGTPDNSFGGGDGIQTLAVGNSGSGADDIVIQPNGAIVAAGWVNKNGFDEFAVVRLLPNGNPDNSFNGTGMFSLDIDDDFETFRSAQLQQDGKIVLAGTSTHKYNGISKEDIVVVRLKANGQLDPTFGMGDGIAKLGILNMDHVIRDMVIQPDGKILIGGSVQPVEGFDFANCLLARFNPNGTPDLSFDGTGMVVSNLILNDESIESIALQPNGKLVTTGFARVDNGNASYRYDLLVARFFTGLTVSTSAPDVFSDKISLYPNPVREQATLEYELHTAQSIAIDLYDLQGRFIQNLQPSMEKPAGKHAETLLFAKDLPSGNYLIMLKSETGTTAIEAIF